MKEAKACVIFDASFGSGSGHEIALCERVDVGRKAKRELENAGFQARLTFEAEGKERLWYLATLCPLHAYVYFPLDVDHRSGSPCGSTSAA